MPIYYYRCRACKTVHERIRPIKTRNRIVACKCGGTTEFTFPPTNVNKGWSKEWKFAQLDPRPDCQDENNSASFESKADYERHLKKHDLAEYGLTIREI